MRKQNDREWKVIQKSITITFFFYWIALLLLSVYTLITRDELGPPFIIMNAGTVIFFSSFIIIKSRAKKESKIN
ncbi:hypothetical protein VBD025_04335 [Virgibacillus flavescens]|uniref:hypothetical protein n=1 Tax=Virgibacillus flavescens TaxID=1611422 RepID=UPI003D34024A